MGEERKTGRLSLAAAILALVAIPASASGLGTEGWGVRVGLGDDPDQAIIGFQLNLGEIVERLRLQPNLEAGFGDDHTIVSVTVPVHYRFAVDAVLTPYLGGGLIAAFIDRDRPRGDDSDFDLGAVGVAGVEWRLAGGSDLFVEFNLLGGDTHDAKLLVGWMFRR